MHPPLPVAFSLGGAADAPVWSTPRDPNTAQDRSRMASGGLLTAHGGPGTLPEASKRLPQTAPRGKFHWFFNGF